MFSLRKKLSILVADAFETCGLDRQFGTVTLSNRPDLGQFQCNGAIAIAQRQKEKPYVVAQKIVDVLNRSDMLKTVSIAGAGFINLTVKDEFLVSCVNEMMKDTYLGCEQVPNSETVIVDYGGANVAKPLHVGHLRAAIIGESLKLIARFLGYKVIGDIHLGDWGLQMGMIISEVERRQPNLPYFDISYSGPYPNDSPVTIQDLEEIYPTVSAQAKIDPIIMQAARQATYDLQWGRPGYRALWENIKQVSVADLREDYSKLHVEFDLWLGESDVQNRIPVLIKKLKQEGWAYESQGALIIDVAEPNDKNQIPPFILTKSDGAILYSTTDLATIEQRIEEYKPSMILYVVDKRQGDHFRQVFRCAYKTNIAPRNVVLEHIAFGTMNGKDGTPFKTRSGGVLKLKDLIRMIKDKALEKMADVDIAKDYDEAEKMKIAQVVGLAALKFADLMNHHSKDYVFDLDRFSSFEGCTGPYLLYSNVRVKSILRKAKDNGLIAEEIVQVYDDMERGILLKISSFPDLVSLAFENRAPNYLCDYAFDLASLFSRFYNEHHILSEDNILMQLSWLGLVSATMKTLEKTIYLLGMESLEKM